MHTVTNATAAATITTTTTTTIIVDISGDKGIEVKLLENN